MDAEDFVIDDCSEGKVIKYICAVSPHVYTAVLSKTLIVETVDLGDLSTLVVATDQGDSLWVSHLEPGIISTSLGGHLPSKPGVKGMFRQSSSLYRQSRP